MENAIELKNLRKEYGTKIAVKGLTLEVPEGSLLGLLGVNGAGKTTTIKMLTGLTGPTYGEAFVCGKSILTELDTVKQLVNVSTQESAVAPKLSVRENLEFMAGVYGKDKRSAAQAAEAMIRKMQLTEVAESKAKTLSGGWQRRLSIAMALITEPKVLFLDEPTLGLDVLARRELWKVIENLKGKITIVLTTHYMEEAEALSDQIAVMADGEMKALGTARQLMEQTGQNSLENAFIAIVEQETVTLHDNR